MDVVLRGGLHFDGDRLYFDQNEDELLDDKEDIFMVDTRASVL